MTPTEPGYYWAKPTGGEQIGVGEWAIVHLWECGDITACDLDVLYFKASDFTDWQRIPTPGEMDRYIFDVIKEEVQRVFREGPDGIRPDPTEPGHENG